MARLCRVRKQSTLGVGEFFVRIFVLERGRTGRRPEQDLGWPA
jgi:hypothetical protein